MAAIEKHKQDSLKKYGFENPTQNFEVQRKIIISNWQTMILKHWKTNEDLLVRASFEWAVVKYLNKHKIDFKWQIPFYLNINNKNVLYICDLYLPERDLYVEIKGCFKSEMNRIKWEEFHKLYKNSEIWFSKDVEKFVEEKRYKFYKIYRKEYDEYTRKNNI